MRKIGFITLLIMAAVLLIMAFPAAAAGPKTPIAPATPAASTPAAPAVAAMPEEHPHIHEALEAMRAAKGHLDAAPAEYHGHRARAIEHLNQAIREAEICEHEK